jgi:hypothetical protein
MRLRSTRRVASILYATHEAAGGSAFHCFWVLHSLLALHTVSQKYLRVTPCGQQCACQCELLMIIGQRVVRVGQASSQLSASASSVGHHLHHTSGSERFCDFIGSRLGVTFASAPVVGAFCVSCVGNVRSARVHPRPYL